MTPLGWPAFQGKRQALPGLASGGPARLRPGVAPVAERTGYVQSRVRPRWPRSPRAAGSRSSPIPRTAVGRSCASPARVQTAAAELRASTEPQTLQELLAELLAARRETITGALEVLYHLLQRHVQPTGETAATKPSNSNR